MPSANLRYSHRQTSTKALMLAPLAVVAGVAVLLILDGPTRAPLVVPLAIVGAIAVLVVAVVAVFSTLIIEVTDSAVVVGFRFGAMQRRIPFTDIVRAQRTTLAWWYGGGVKYGWSTTSYLVRPGPAVELTLRTGRTLRIGTDDPDGLLAAIGQ